MSALLLLLRRIIAGIFAVLRPGARRAGVAVRAARGGVAVLQTQGGHARATRALGSLLATNTIEE